MTARLDRGLPSNVGTFGLSRRRDASRASLTEKPAKTELTVLCQRQLGILETVGVGGAVIRAFRENKDDLLMTATGLKLGGMETICLPFVPVFPIALFPIRQQLTWLRRIGLVITGEDVANIVDLPVRVPRIQPYYAVGINLVGGKETGRRKVGHHQHYHHVCGLAECLAVLLHSPSLVEQLDGGLIAHNSGNRIFSGKKTGFLLQDKKLKLVTVGEEGKARYMSQV